MLMFFGAKWGEVKVVSLARLSAFPEVGADATWIKWSVEPAPTLEQRRHALTRHGYAHQTRVCGSREQLRKVNDHANHHARRALCNAATSRRGRAGTEGAGGEVQQ